MYLCASNMQSLYLPSALHKNRRNQRRFKKCWLDIVSSSTLPFFSFLILWNKNNTEIGMLFSFSRKKVFDRGTHKTQVECPSFSYFLWTYIVLYCIPRRSLSFHSTMVFLLWLLCLPSEYNWVSWVWKSVATIASGTHTTCRNVYVTGASMVQRNTFIKKL